MQLRTFAAMASALALGLSAASWAYGQAAPWPDKPIKLIVPTAPAGPTDTLGRYIGERLAQALKQSVVVENKPGVNGTLGIDAVAKSAPDGHTLLFTYAASIAVNPGLYPKLPYDTLRDLAPIGQVGHVGNILVVTPDLPIHDVKDLIAYAKARPGQLSYGSWGNGSGGHLTMESLQAHAGLKMQHVPYKGVAPLVNDMLGGVVKIAFVDAGSQLAMFKAGKLRPIAVSGPRQPELSELRTLPEQGVPFDTASWYGLFAPAKTPAPILQRLNVELNRLLSTPEFQTRLRQFNTPDGPRATPEEFRHRVETDMAVWKKIIVAADVKID